MKRLTHQFVKEQFEKEGCELLSKEYVGCKQKLWYICQNGHKHSIIWDDWKQGHRCPYCYGNVKLTIGFIKNEFEKENYILLTEEYINSNQKLDYICPEGHRYSTNWNSWNIGRRCPCCAGQIKPTIEFIKTEFKKERYILLSTEYKNCSQKLEYICPKGHEHSISWSNWKAGKRCPYCAGVVKPIVEFIKAEFKKEGYELLSTEYTNAHQKLEYICSNGHKHKITWNNWQQGKRCPYCVGKISKGEIEVKNFIESLGIKVSPNDRSQIFNPETGNGFELDIFMPDFDKAVEYNGEYWHKSYGRTNNDALKRYLCKQNNINLLIVWDYEWLSNNSICKNKIKKFVMGL